MSYGIYTKDLKGCSLSDVTFEMARQCLIPGLGHVICCEKDKFCGFSLHVTWHTGWCFRIKPRLKYLELGFIGISWFRLTRKVPDHIVNLEKPS